MGWNNLIGMRLDQYEILGELGRGGSSRVYHAYDTTLKRDVAIKVIPNDAEDRALFTSRFAREVAAVQKLHHPNVVAVFGAGETDEFVYLVMQCVTGGTLRRQLTGPLPVPDAVSYVVQIAYALQHAHDKGIIHRDVKPSNMLLEYPGSKHMLLTDFGIAKIQGARGMTKSGTTIGTPEYMSPQQAEGRYIDERSDIYALGCVLYETLAGRPPFLGSTPVSVLFQQVHSRPAYIRGFNPSVPTELVQILEIALAKRPDERYGTAEAFAQALRPFAGELPSVTPPPEAGPIVIARSTGLVPSRPLPPNLRLTENDIAERDTQESPLVGARARITEETTAPLPTIGSRKTLPPFSHLRRPQASAQRAQDSVSPSRARKTLPPFVRVRRAAPLSELNLPLGLPESTGMPAVAASDTVDTGVVGGASVGSREPIRLPIRSNTLRSAATGHMALNATEPAREQGQRAPNSRPSPTSAKQSKETRIPATWPQPRKPRNRMVGLIAAILVLGLFGWLALNASGVGALLGNRFRSTSTAQKAQTVLPTSTLEPTATAAPTRTSGPQPTATLTQQQKLNQQAYASFRAVTMATFADGSCSGSNARSSFGSGQAIYVNLCTSSRALSAPMTVAIRQGGQVVYTMVYGRYISQSSTYYYYTSHVFSPGTYDVLVTLSINGTTAVARDITLYIK